MLRLLKYLANLDMLARMEYALMSTNVRVIMAADTNVGIWREVFNATAIEATSCLAMDTTVKILTSVPQDEMFVGKGV